MPEALTIKKDDNTFSELLDFQKLRAKGIEHIAAFSGDIWTDHNLHDPGITILEVLCYALMDLGYRNALPVKDLVARNPAQKNEKDANFFTPAEILTCNPLTILDYRKMLLDIDGVRNAWLEVSDAAEMDLVVNCEENRLKFASTIRKDNPSNQLNKSDKPLILNGLYKVFIELENQTLLQDNCQNPNSLHARKVLKKVNQQLHAHRNLGEDFVEVMVLQDEQFGICADFDLAPAAVPDEVLLALYEKIQEFLSPTLPFYTLQEMLERGKPIEDIFAGRPMTKESHGFIDTDDLEKLDRRTTIFASDIYRILMEDERVQAVKNLYLFSFLDGQPQTTGEAWCLELTDLHRPVFSPALSNFNFFKGVLPFQTNKKAVSQLFNKRLSNYRKVQLKPYQLDYEIPQGQYRKDLGTYRSIQHEFPLNYRVGEGELPKSITTKRQAQALQLKAYLLFFDQILTNFLGQLANARAMFSMAPLAVAEMGQQQTFFHQELTDVPGFNHLIRFHKDNQQQQPFHRGETVARYVGDAENRMPKTAAARDKIIADLANAVKNEQFVLETKKVDCGYVFTVQSKQGEPWLEGEKVYDDEAAALKGARILNFLAVLPECFKKNNHQRAQSFGFEIQFKPQNYQSYLAQITENATVFQQRKDQFLNHLLARFAEDFTEYATLMFALNGEIDEAQLIEEKSHFLANYPEISRNRGRAYDYTAQPIWNTANVSGLENRVTGLMGIKNWQRSYLNNFEVVKRADLYFFSMVDHRGRMLYEGTQGHATAEDAETAFTIFCELILDLKNYADFGCENECVFGFQINDKKRQSVAIHPQNYLTPSARDAAKTCLHEWALGTDEGGLIEIQATETGFVFELLDDDDNLILQGNRTFLTEKETWLEWLFFLELQLDNQHFVVRKQAFGKEYSFQVEMVVEGEIVVLAKHPKTYKSKSAASKKRNQLLRYLRKKGVPFQLVQAAEKFGWQVADEEGNFVLSSFLQEKLEDGNIADSHYFFQNPTQATASFLQLADVLADEANYKLISTAEQHYFVVEASEDYIVARSKNYENLADAEKAMSEIVDCYPNFPFKITRQDGHWQFDILQNDKVQLLGKQRFSDKTDAEIGVYQFLKIAANKDNYQLKNWDACQFGFDLRVEDDYLADHPIAYLQKNQRDDALNSLVDFLQQQQFNFNIARFSGKQQVVLNWLDCELSCAPLLVGPERNSVAAALLDRQQLAALLDENAPDNSAFELQKMEVNSSDEPTIFSFALSSKTEPDLGIIAKHPTGFLDEKERDEVYENARAFLSNFGNKTNTLQTNFKPCTKYLNKKQVDIADEVDVSVSRQSRFANYAKDGYGFRLREKDAIIAHFPKRLPFAEREKWWAQLWNDYKKIPHWTTEILLDGDIYQKQDGQYFFEIKDAKSQLVLWESTKKFTSKADARQLFQQQFFQILDLARSVDNYETGLLKDCPIVYLIAKNGEKIAQIPQHLTTEGNLNELILERKKYARRYPLIREKPGYRFQVVHPETFKIYWQGKLHFATPMEALTSLDTFFELLPFRGNYLKTGDAQKGSYGIELSEVKLESKVCLSEEDAWESVKDFAQEAQEDYSIFRYFDAQAGCKSSFRMVGSHYRLAQHPYQYLTPEARETAISWLHKRANCDGYAISEIDLNLDNVVREIEGRFYFQIQANNAQNSAWWRSCEGYISRKEAQRAFTENYLTILDFAQDVEYYYVVQDAFGKCEIRLRNGAGVCLAVLPIDFVAEDGQARVEAIFDRIQQARQYPFLQKGDKYIFKIYDFDFDENALLTQAAKLSEKKKFPSCFDHSHESTPPKTTDVATTAINPDLLNQCGCGGNEELHAAVKAKLSGAVIWESSAAFNSLEEAFCIFQIFLKRLPERRNFVSSKQPDCEPFSILLTDPKQVFAEHPRTYSTPAELEKAVAQTLHCLNNEGFHVLEHILLRPVSSGCQLLPVCPENPCDFSLATQNCDGLQLTEEDLLFEAYNPGADPYSFWATIVLPSWPIRFQNTNFRTFFESTLRQEAPAHLGFHIVWVNPEQMAAFEEKYRAWLAAKDGALNCNITTAKNELTTILTELRNEYAAAKLIDCGMEGQPLTLGQTKLT